MGKDVGEGQVRPTLHNLCTIILTHICLVVPSIVEQLWIAGNFLNSGWASQVLSQGKIKRVLKEHATTHRHQNYINTLRTGTVLASTWTEVILQILLTDFCPFWLILLGYVVKTTQMKPNKKLILVYFGTYCKLFMKLSDIILFWIMWP